MLAQLGELVRALENDQIAPCFQPIVSLRTGQLRGFEVLTRWVHPEFGPILPDNLIALAEDNGLIGELTNQVFRKAFQATRMLPGRPKLSVNVSPRQMRYTSLPGQIWNSAEEAEFPLDRLTIEITESALLENLTQAGRIAREIKDMGCRLSIDDFGTGYSSLRHLQALPFDQIKIDRSFVSSMTKRRESRKIVAAIVGLGHSLDLAVVAEGIEDEEQTEMLVKMGCELGQGFYYSKPMHASELEGYIAAKPRPVVMTALAPSSAVSILEALPAQRMAQMQAIYDGAPVGLCFVDRGMRYVSLNQRMANMNGLPVEGHLGRTVKELFPEWFTQYEPYLARALEGEATVGVEIDEPATGPRQVEKKIAASYQPVRDEAGEVIGISIAMLDVTEHVHGGGDAGKKRGTKLKSPKTWFLKAAATDVLMN